MKSQSGQSTVPHPNTLLSLFRRECLVALLLVFCGTFAASAQIVQEYYIPVPENQGLAANRSMYTQSRCGGSSADPVDPITTYISISVLRGGTILYYDHWEDGFEANASNPVQSSTKIWGDGNTANGAPPGVASDLLVEGTVIVLQNNVQSTTRQTVIDYDGGDRVSSTFAIAMSRALWATGSSTLHAGAVEMYPTKKWGRNYTIPAGENYYSFSEDPFEYTAALVMAQANNTVVQIDADANGSYESSVTLQQGGSHLVSGLNTSAKITASADVQVDLVTGDVCDNYESRWYVLFPDNLWSNSYYAPVPSPTTSGKRPAVTFLYNPGTTSLTIGVKTRAGTQPNITVPAKSIGTYTMPNNSGAKFTASSNFYALCHQDHYASNSSATEHGHNHNAGFTLVPQSSLSQQVLVGLGLGKDPTSSASGNYSPIYLMADLVCGAAPVDGLIKVYVDYDNNGTDASPIKTDPLTGRQYDAVFNLQPLQPQIVSDTDGDQTGMFAWISDPNTADQNCAVLAAVWTQNGNTAPVGAPSIDVSTTVPSTPVVELTKSSTMFSDANGDGLPNNGDVIRYQIDITNSGLIPLQNVVVDDVFPSSILTYSANTTRLNRNDGSAEITITDNGSGTAFPLDGSGYTITQSIPVGDSFTIRFNALVVNAPAAPGEICNTATATYGLLNSTDTDCLPASENTAGVGNFAWLDQDKDGIQDGGESGMANVQVRLFTAAGAQVGSTVTTGSGGSYLFSQIPPGSYYLSYVAPAGYGLSPQDVGSNDAVDSDANPSTLRTANFNLVQDVTDTTRDAGVGCLPIVLTCPPNRVLDCVSPNITPAATGTATGVSPCGCAVTITYTDSSAASCGSTYAKVISRTWRAQDSCGNVSTCVQSITIQDTTAPIISGVGGSSTIACTATPVFSTPTATDACDSTPSLSFSDSTAPGSCAQSFTRTRTWTAVDDCGNIRTTAQSIVVQDSVQPVLSGVPAAVTIACSAALPAAPTVTASDNCDTSVPVIASSSTTPGSCPQAYTLTRVWTATDDCGNVRTASQVITVTDTVKPTLSGVPAPVTIQCSASLPSAPTVTATDNCDASVPVVLSSANTPGSCPQSYTLTRTWTATDDCGNVQTASQAITILDTTAPVLAGVPAAATVQCSAIPTPPTVTASDTCDASVSVVLSSVTTPGSCAQNYTLTRTWTATDDCGNSQASSQVLTVRDTVAPTFTGVGSNGTRQCAVGLFSNPSITDACDPTPTLTFSDTVTPGACANAFQHMRTWTATDACGNVRTASQTITVVDTIIPVLVGVPAAATVSCSSIPTPAAVTATDNCTASPVVVFATSTTAGTCPQSYTVTRTWTATDVCGNVATGSQILTVQDTQAPVLTGVPTNISVECSNLPTPPTVTASDNCDTTVPVVLSSSTAAGTCPQRYTLTRTWTAVDDCGNQAQGSQVITVVDTTLPVLSGVPAPVTVDCAAALPVAPTVTASDNCDTTVPVVLSTSNTPGSCPQSYTLTRTWTATDDCGNVRTASQAISVVDTTQPILSGVPGPVTVQCTSIPAAPTTVTALDNCDTTVPVVLSSVTTPGACAQTYTLTRTWTATDDCGNAGAGSQVITVRDTVAPTFTGVGSSASRQCSSGLFSNPSLTDNCDPSPVLTFADVIVPGVCPSSFVQTRTWTGTDACGNTRTASQTITVVDTVAPVISGVGADGFVHCDAPIVFSSPTASDNCPGTISLTFADTDVAIFGSCPQNFMRTRTWTATDGCGNSSTAQQTITMRDTSGDICYALADGGPVGGDGNGAARDLLVKIDKYTGTTTSIGSPSSYNGESLVYWPPTDTLFTFDANKLIRISPATGASVQIGSSTTQVKTGALGNISINDIDGLAFDATVSPPILYATHRRGGGLENDLLLIVNTNNGVFVSNAFGPGKDYLVVQNLTVTNSTGSAVVLDDVDDIAHDPSTGSLYAILNDSGTEDHLVTIDLVTGGVNYVGDLMADDAEGLTFYVDGTMFVSTGSAGISSMRDRLFDVSKANGLASNPRSISYGEDYEGLSCFTAKTSLVGDKVWLDIDGDGIQDAGEPGIPGVTVSIYRTFDNTVVQTKETDGDGTFSFVIVPAEYFLEFTLPAGYVFTTANAPGSTSSNDSTANSLTGRTPAFFQSNFETDLTQDAGMRCLNPILQLPADATVQCTGSVLPADMGQATATSPCGCPLAISYTDSVVPGCGASRVISRQWTATDECGNTISGVQTITVVDTVAPVLANVPSALTMQCNATLTTPAVTATDNCDVAVQVTLSVVSTPGVCPQTYTLTRTWSAADACGNAVTGTQVVTVRDTVAPTFTGVGSNGTRQCAVGLFSNPSIVDNCDPSPSLTSADTITPGTCPNNFTHRRTWTATDACGNVRTASQTITVVDTVNPVLVGLPANATVSCSAIPTPATVTATDACTASPSVVLSVQTVPGLCPGAYTLTRTWTATDSCGNASSGSQVLTVVDTTPPELAGVPANITAECSALPSLPTITASDACDSTVPVVFSSSTAAGTCTDAYTLTRTWTATDDCGNVRSVSQVITVVDTTQPILAGVPGAITVECSVAIPAPPTVTATDNCDTTVPVVLSTATAAGTCPQAYTLTRTWTATDNCGNVRTGTQVVSVVDTTQPVLSGVPSAATVQCSNLPAPAVVTASDNCDTVVPVTLSLATTPGVCAQTYTLTRTWTATDDCGNTRSGSQVITVRDTVAPTFTGVGSNGTRQCNVGLFSNPSITDNCDPTPVLTSQDTTVPGTCPNNYVRTRTWTATDACGNARTASQTITVVDTLAPVLSGVPADATVACSSIPAPATVTASDGCDASPVVVMTSSTTPGSCPQAYTLTRVWTATDSCANARTGTQVLTVVDTTAPLITGVAASTTVECSTADPFSHPVPVDACDPAPLISFSDVSTPGSCAQQYSVLRTWTATDACGNSSTASQTVAFVDTTAPVFSGVGGALQIECGQPLVYSSPTATDNCNPAPVITFADATVAATCPSIALHTRTWTAVDACGNARTASQTITVVDTTAAVISGVGGPLTRECSDALDFSSPIATDVCDPAPALVHVDATVPGSCPQSYLVTRTWTATDACGNSSTASQSITVQDTTGPVFSGVGAAVTRECVAGDFSNPSILDACDALPTLLFADVTVPGTCAQNYVRTRTWTATDACGNVTTASQAITVVDTTAPVFSGVGGPATIDCLDEIIFSEPTAADACDPLSPTITHADATLPGSCPQSFVRTRTWTALDSCGNARTASQSITVQDTTAPEIAFIFPMTLEGDAACRATMQAVSLFASDDCDASLAVSQVPAVGAVLEVGVHTVTVTVSDDCGNFSVDQSTVTVICNAPDIAVLKSVYIGHDAGVGCPGLEKVHGVAGTPVTYCFLIVNNGYQTLSNVTITDAALGIAPINIGPLASEATAVRFVETTLTADLLNLGVVTGTPNSGANVTDTDTASVDLYSPTILMEKTVMAGANGTCPGVEQVSALNGSDLTYCFVISNTSDTLLQGVTLSDPDLGMSPLHLGTLLAGHSVTAAVNAVTSGTLTNTAFVTATPPMGVSVSDSDTASVLASGPGIRIEKSVYAGHNAGAGCPGSEVLATTPAQAVTYCFSIRNVGDVTLTSVVLDDPLLGLAGMAVGTLASGQVASHYAEAVVSVAVTNLATVTGTVSPGVTVQDSDIAEVGGYAPGILLHKKLFAGHGAATACAGAGDTLTAPLGENVTYCFEVVNTGNTHLNDVTVLDSNLGIDQSAMNFISGQFPLAPGETLLFTYQALAQGSLVNVATTTGQPVNSNGVLITGVAPPQDTDTATLTASGQILDQN